MTTVLIPHADQVNENHHGTDSIEQIALTIYEDLISDAPTYAHDLAKAGKYARQLQPIEAASKIGKAQALGVVEAIKLRPNSELARLLSMASFLVLHR